MLGGAHRESTSPKRGGSAARTGLRSSAFRLHGLRGVVVASAASAGDGKWAAVWWSRQRAERYGAEDGRGRRGGYGAMGGSHSVCCVRGMVPVVCARPRFGAVAGVGAEDGGGARRNDEGGVGNRERPLRFRWYCASYSQCRTGAGFKRRIDAPGTRVDREEWSLLKTHLVREEAIKAAPAMGNAIARAAHAGGGEGGSGEYGSHNVREGDIGGEERQRRVLRVQPVVRVRLEFAPAWRRACGRGRNGREGRHQLTAGQNAAAIAAAEARADEVDKKTAKKTRKKAPLKSKPKLKPKNKKTASELEDPDELDDTTPDAQEAEINNILIEMTKRHIRGSQSSDSEGDSECDSESDSGSLKRGRIIEDREVILGTQNHREAESPLLCRISSGGDSERAQSHSESTRESSAESTLKTGCLFPGVGGISRDGGKPKSHFYYKLAQSCFKEHEKYRDTFAKATTPKKQWVWSNKIKNRLKTLVTKGREHIVEMGETGAGIKNAEEIVPGTPLANKWSKLWFEPQWFKLV
ncbi:hypothetical protein DFH09DRAFT_1118787 [Mycena vulgaris]|nr:hypothetical protein DFH09DRAFT_1118787 [Mycena vulgaris]